MLPPWTGHSSHQLSAFVLEEACGTQKGLQKLDLVGPVWGASVLEGEQTFP